jgi:glycosyltransferase involved in cell wall biosynthesis
LAIVVPARNEEVLLPRCISAISSTIAMAGTTAQLIVVANRCTDSTETVARGLGAVVVRTRIAMVALACKPRTAIEAV